MNTHVVLWSKHALISSFVYRLLCLMLKLVKQKVIHCYILTSLVGSSWTVCVCHPSVNPQPTTGLRPQKLNFVVCDCEPLHTTKFHTEGLTLWEVGWGTWLLTLGSSRCPSRPKWHEIAQKVPTLPIRTLCRQISIQGPPTKYIFIWVCEAETGLG